MLVHWVLLKRQSSSQNILEHFVLLLAGFMKLLFDFPTASPITHDATMFGWIQIKDETPEPAIQMTTAAKATWVCITPQQSASLVHGAGGLTKHKVNSLS